MHDPLTDIINKARFSRISEVITSELLESLEPHPIVLTVSKELIMIVL